MGILNYSTKVPVLKTVSQVQGILVSHGARSILVNYDENQQPESLSFRVLTSQGELPFRLPANVKAVQELMLRERLRGYNKDGQATRVAWRIIKDWVEAQMALIEAEMVSMEEVFLPYLLRGDKTLFQIISERGYQLTEGKGDSR